METQHRARARRLARRRWAVLAAAAAVAAVALGLADPGPPQLPTPPARPVLDVPSAPGPAAFGWHLTAAISAHRALVLEVETTRPAEAPAIARQLAESYQDRFDEVLVYVYTPDVVPRRAHLRIQWTRSSGYRTLALRPEVLRVNRNGR